MTNTNAFLLMGQYSVGSCCLSLFLISLDLDLNALFAGRQNPITTGLANVLAQ